MMKLRQILRDSNFARNTYIREIESTAHIYYENIEIVSFFPIGFHFYFIFGEFWEVSPYFYGFTKLCIKMGTNLKIY